MIGNRIAALSLATLLAGISSGAWAGSTGPTHPEGHDPDSPAMELKSDQEDKRQHGRQQPRSRRQGPGPEANQRDGQ